MRPYALTALLLVVGLARPAFAEDEEGPVAPKPEAAAPAKPKPADAKPADSKPADPKPASPLLGDTPPPEQKPQKAPSPTVPLSDEGAGARALGWTLLIGGVVVGTAGGILGVIADGRIETNQATLAEKCGEWLSKPDSCRKARHDKDAGDVQSSNDAISRWSGVWIGSFVGLGTGITVAAIGTVRLLTAPSPPRVTAGIAPHVAMLPGGGYLGVTGAF